jgi:hypothetical protein
MIERGVDGGDQLSLAGRFAQLQHLVTGLGGLAAESLGTKPLNSSAISARTSATERTPGIGRHVSLSSGNAPAN